MLEGSITDDRIFAWRGKGSQVCNLASPWNKGGLHGVSLAATNPPRRTATAVAAPPLRWRGIFQALSCRVATPSAERVASPLGQGGTSGGFSLIETPHSESSDWELSMKEESLGTSHCQREFTAEFREYLG